MQLSDDQKAALDRVGRQFDSTIYTGGFSQLLQDILDAQEKGAAGIVADARDVNGLAASTMVARVDKTVGPGSSLTFAWAAFRFHNGKALVVVSAGSLALAASTTNYVEVDRAGTVTSNTTGFTSGRFPLWQVTTGASTFSHDTGVLTRASTYVLIGLGGVDGSMGSTPMQTKEEGLQLGTIATAAGANEFTLTVPKTVAAGSKLTNVRFVNKDALTASDANYVKFGVINKQTGAGAQVLVDDTAAANSTKATGGTALAAYTGRDLTLVTLTGGTERDVSGGHTLQILLTVVGTLVNTLRSASMLFEFSFAN